jgi:hypothetical protein
LNGLQYIKNQVWAVGWARLWKKGLGRLWATFVTQYFQNLSTNILWSVVCLLLLWHPQWQQQQPPGHAVCQFKTASHA